MSDGFMELKTMRRDVFIFGLLLVFGGMILASSYNFSMEVPNQETVAIESLKWEISGSFHKGDNVTLHIRPGQSWSEHPILADPNVGPLPANVTILAPGKGEAKLNVTFEVPPMSLAEPGQDPLRLPPPVLTHLEVISSVGDIFELGVLPEQTGAINLIIKHDGTYVARVEKEGLWWVIAPPPAPQTLEFVRYVVDVEYPFVSFLSIGTIACVFGLGLCVWSGRSSRRKVAVSRRRR